MLATLGDFVFSLKTVPFNNVAKSTSYKWAKGERIGQRPSTQFVSEGDGSLTYSCMIAPQITGPITNLDRLHEMAQAGEAYQLVKGNGQVLGAWYIESIEENETHHLIDGTPQKINFTLKLSRYGE